MRVSKMIERTLYTDGACPGNGTEDAKGGYGWALENKITKSFTWCSKMTERYGKPTNQKCELMAVAQIVFATGVEVLGEKPWYADNLYCPETGEIQYLLHIKSDSKYVVDGINHWLRSWKANGWKNSKKKPISNMQMWKDLDAVLSYGHLRGCFTFSYVPGHSGDPGNNAADQAARDGVDNGTTIPENAWKELMDMLTTMHS